MIAFVQSFGLNSPGGGPRILRSLLEAASAPYLSVCTKPRVESAQTAHEVHLPIRPWLGRIESTRLAGYLRIHQLELWLGGRFRRRLDTLFEQHDVTAVHAIPHRMDFWYAYQVAEERGLPYYLNVHDELAYNLRGTGRYLERAQERLAHVWPRADGRIVISEAMGEEYCRRYGERPYTVVTDGLTGTLPEEPHTIPDRSLRVYFMGALHLTYHPNFQALTEALTQVQHSAPAFDTALIARGSALPVDEASFRLEERPFAAEEVVQQDFEEVDVLYLPLPFGEEYEPFWRYSLSTKLVTYLGSGVPILYHGPKEAAAARLLDRYDAALQVHSLDSTAIAEALQRIPEVGGRVAGNALRLGGTQFRQKEMQSRFWTMLAGNCEDASPEGKHTMENSSP